MSQPNSECPSVGKKLKLDSVIAETLEDSTEIKCPKSPLCNNELLNTSSNVESCNKLINLSHQISQTDILTDISRMKSTQVLHKDDKVSIKSANILPKNSQNSGMLCASQIPTAQFICTTPGVNISRPVFITTIPSVSNIQMVTPSVCNTPQLPLILPRVSNLNGMTLVNMTPPPIAVSTIPVFNGLVVGGAMTGVSIGSGEAPAQNCENKVKTVQELLQDCRNIGISSTILSKGDNGLKDELSQPAISKEDQDSKDKISPKDPKCSKNDIGAPDIRSEGSIDEDNVSDSPADGKTSVGESCTSNGQNNSIDLPTSSQLIEPEEEKEAVKSNTFELTQSERSDSIPEKCDRVRPLRKSQRRGRSCDSAVCPVCRVAIRLSDITEHLSTETARLNKWAHDYRKKQSRKHPIESGNVPGVVTSQASHKDRYQSFLRVKHNRQARGSSTSKRGSGTQCPVCNERISGTQYQLSQHVEKCLQKEQADVDIEGSSDSEGATEGYEEYEWAGQTRIRVTSLLPGSGLAESGFVVGQKSAEDVELDIEEDETGVYGQAQYNEADLIPCVADEPEEESGRQAIRDILLQQSAQGSGSSTQRSTQQSDKWSSEDGSQPGGSDGQGKDSPSTISEETSSSNEKTAEKALTTVTSSSDKYRCLICMADYDSPATSIQCWHVYCEECWLRTLGAKKLCPQCNVITHPSDLRRIFI